MPSAHSTVPHGCSLCNLLQIKLEHYAFSSAICSTSLPTHLTSTSSSLWLSHATCELLATASQPYGEHTAGHLQRTRWRTRRRRRTQPGRPRHRQLLVQLRGFLRGRHYHVQYCALLAAQTCTYIQHALQLATDWLLLTSYYLLVTTYY